MFISCALAFAAGTYVAAVLSIPLAWMLAACLVFVVLIPCLIRRRRLAAILLLVAFFSCGALRLSTVINADQRAPDGMSSTPDLFEGTITEASSRLKTIRLTLPRDLNDTAVVFATDQPLEVGDTVRLWGQLRELEPSFRNPGVGSWKWVKRLEGVAFELRGKVLSASRGAGSIHRLRGYLKRTIEASGAAHTAILTSLTVGDRSGLDGGINQLFQRTGTSHVLAISGFNVGIVTGFFFFIARALLGRSRRLRLSGRHTRYAALLTIPFPFVFMLVAGSGVSVIRATIMTVVFMLALYFEREHHFYNTLALSAIVILLVYPHSLFAPSFQLTFMSLLFIVLVMEKVYPLLQRLRNRSITWTLSTILSTTAATLGTAPIVIYYFFGINPFAAIHNLVTIPLTGVVATVLALVGMTAPVGAPLLHVAGFIVDLNIRALRFLDFGYIFPVVRFDLAEVLLYYAFLLALLRVERKPVQGLLLFVLVPALALLSYQGYRERFGDKLCMSVIDVGSGDAILLEAPGGSRILIDGGGAYGDRFDAGRQVITPVLLVKKIRTLDYVVSTHPHADHAGGLAYIVEHFRVRIFASGGFHPQDTRFTELVDLLRKRGVPMQIWKPGESFAFGPGTTATVLHGGNPPPGENPNDASVVLRVRSSDHAFLLTGDIGETVEAAMVASGAAIRSNVLKVGHHGSRSSSTYPFLLAVRPSLAVLSTGRGVPYLPSDETLERFRRLNIPVLRTDKHGMIEVCSDGKALTWRTYAR